MPPANPPEGDSSGSKGKGKRTKPARDSARIHRLADRFHALMESTVLEDECRLSIPIIGKLSGRTLISSCGEGERPSTNEARIHECG
jgi:hypothetical protein